MTLTASTMQKRLLAWFDQHGRKSLPWQINKTPYRVWVSEIMLQQTQVSTVIPYFERFMQRFPSVSALASADENDVLHLWAGLGYYSRARNLHRAAKTIQHDLGGKFPDTLETLSALPGIGNSTAGAILSIAYQIPTPILDGNVKRVISRLHGILTPVNDRKTEQTLWQLATRYTPQKRVADYTQAIMDLGATVCTRSKPGCTECPLERYCIAAAEDLTTSIPAKKTTKKIPTKQATLLVIQHQGKILLQKRPSSGIWGGLYSLPELSGIADDDSISRYCQKAFNLTVKALQPLENFKHTFSHYHLQIHPILLKVKRSVARIMEDGQQIWYNLEQPDNIGLPKPVQTILQRLP